MNLNLFFLQYISLNSVIICATYLKFARNIYKEILNDLKIFQATRILSFFNITH